MLETYKKRHAKQLSNSENTILNLRVKIEKAKFDIQEKEFDTACVNMQVKPCQSYRSSIQMYEDSYKESSFATMDMEKTRIPIHYHSHYDHTMLNSSPIERIVARVRGILTSIFVLILVSAQFYIVWGNVDASISVILIRIELVCVFVLAAKLLYWIARGGLREFLNS